jgi:Mn2+/Fe2+ NRAMP family transporter
MVMSSVPNGILLPFVLLFALSLVNDKRLMGGHTNPGAYNYVTWATIIAVIALSGVMLVTAAAPFD